MCCLFGLMDHRGVLTVKQKNRMFYADGDRKFLQFHYRRGTQLSGLVTNGDFSASSIITINGVPGHAFISNAPNIANSVVWEVNNVLFEISGFLSAEELIRLAESVEKVS